jgi:hypothetical protein
VAVAVAVVLVEQCQVLEGGPVVVVDNCPFMNREHDTWKS